jgi:hypothetical protein
MILVYIRIYQVAKTHTRTMSEKKRDLDSPQGNGLDRAEASRGGSVKSSGNGSVKDKEHDNGHCQRGPANATAVSPLPNDPKTPPPTRGPDPEEDYDDSSSSDEKPKKHSSKRGGGGDDKGRRRAFQMPVPQAPIRRKTIKGGKSVSENNMSNGCLDGKRKG